MIEVKNIIKEVEVGCEKLRIIKDISLKIVHNEYVCICGHSGSGKTTLLGIMSGIDKPTSGEIIVNDVNIYNLSEDKLAQFRNENFGIVFQNFNLISNLTSKENVEIPRLLAKKGFKGNNTCEELLEIVGLKEKINTVTANMSGGEQQRVAIARALIQNPKIIFADEPTGSLDYENSIQILDMFDRIRKELGVIIIVITHEDYVSERADRIIKLKDGEIL